MKKKTNNRKLMKNYEKKLPAPRNPDVLNTKSTSLVLFRNPGGCQWYSADGEDELVRFLELKSVTLGFVGEFFPVK